MALLHKTTKNLDKTDETTVFKRPYIKQQRTVITERQKTNAMCPLIDKAYCLERFFRKGETSWSPAHFLSWRNITKESRETKTDIIHMEEHQTGFFWIPNDRDLHWLNLVVEYLVSAVSLISGFIGGNCVRLGKESTKRIRNNSAQHSLRHNNDVCFHCPVLKIL